MCVLTKADVGGDAAKTRDPLKGDRIPPEKRENAAHAGDGDQPGHALRDLSSWVKVVPVSRVRDSSIPRK